jgi:hypothetical protein
MSAYRGRVADRGGAGGAGRGCVGGGDVLLLLVYEALAGGLAAEVEEGASAGAVQAAPRWSAGLYARLQADLTADGCGGCWGAVGERGARPRAARPLRTVCTSAARRPQF